MPNDECEQCRWYDPNSECEGLCRVDAPTVSENGRGVWPIVDPRDFCGKFEHRSEGGLIL